ncbi:prepilin peptidase [Streptomyces sp. NBC_01264]|uniref:prepilin peptidase n=1 Tax=Streptomyces sp. NBC_01264 TaxID=2903804 RepID=UPI0022599DA3|nr:A24 family peptidase [Streptomyces sp. NBC_01264]MCX4780327.1 A24 family peptidase [Streptomyces sp. NBC_01264]
MGITLFVAGVTLWGTAAGLLLPRAAYRLSVEAGLPWRSACPAGHPLTGPAGGWLGLPVCPRCGPARHAAPDADTGTGTGTGTDPASGSAPAPGSAAALDPAADGWGGARRPCWFRWRGGYAPVGGAVLAAVLVCLALGAGVGARPELVAWLVLAPFTVLLCFVDQAVHRLPDVVTLPLAAATVVALGVAALFTGTGGSWTRALLGGLTLGAVYLVLHLIYPPGMGFGDVTLALTVGQILGWYGWFVLFAGSLAGFTAAAVHGYARVALRRVERGTSIAFGPFMAGGALAGVIYAGLGLGLGLDLGLDLGSGPVLGAGPVP